MTIRAAPETAFNDLMHRLVELVFDSRGANFELRRIEREIDKLERFDRSGALELRGHVAAARGDHGAVDTCFAHAIAISDDYTGSIVRYLIVLGLTVRGDKVLETFRNYEHALRTDPEALRQSQSVLVGTGWAYTAHAIDADLERLGVQRQTSDCMSYFNEAWVDEGDIAQVVQFVRRFLHDQNAPAKSVDSSVIPDGEGRSALMYELTVDKSPDVVAALEWQLFGALETSDFVADKCGHVNFGLIAGNGAGTP